MKVTQVSALQDRSSPTWFCKSGTARGAAKRQPGFLRFPGLAREPTGPRRSVPVGWTEVKEAESHHPLWVLDLRGMHSLIQETLLKA